METTYKYEGYMTEYECSLEVGCSIDEMYRAVSGSEGKIAGIYPDNWTGWQGPKFEPHPSVAGTPAQYDSNVCVLPDVTARAFILVAKQGLPLYREHQRRQAERNDEFKRSYDYRLSSAINHFSDLPEPKSNDDFKTYLYYMNVQQHDNSRFLDGGPYAGETAIWVEAHPEIHVPLAYPKKDGGTS